MLPEGFSGPFCSVGTFFPAERPDMKPHEDERCPMICSKVGEMPDRAENRDGIVRLHWRFADSRRAYLFWKVCRARFPDLPWNLLHNPAWIHSVRVPDALPEEF